MAKKLIEKEAFVEVSTTVLAKQKAQSKQRQVKKIKIRPFVTDTAHVSIKYGMTIPTGDWSSARVDVMISTPCYKEELIEEYKMVRKLVDKLITIEVDKLTSGGANE